MVVENQRRRFKARHNSTHLTVIFKDKPGKTVAECQQSGFYWSKDNGGGGDNWTYKTCKAAME